MSIPRMARTKEARCSGERSSSRLDGSPPEDEWGVAGAGPHVWVAEEEVAEEEVAREEAVGEKVEA